MVRPGFVKAWALGPNHPLQVVNEQIIAPSNEYLRAFLVHSHGVPIDPIVKSWQIELTNLPDYDCFWVGDAEARQEASYCAEDEDSVAYLYESTIDSYVQNGSLQWYNLCLRLVMTICV